MMVVVVLELGVGRDGAEGRVRVFVDPVVALREPGFDLVDCVGEEDGFLLQAC